MRKILLLLTGVILLCVQVHAQTRTVTGKVTDESGNPIPNASVLVKGTSVGTVTKTDGTYSLSVPSSAKVLIISAITMEPQEIRLGSSSVIDAALKAVNSNLQEVVVVGYTTQTKRTLTGSVVKIDGSATSNKPVLSFDQALTGKAPGVLVNTSSGLVGDNVIIRIRGAASISLSSQPLIVMDGVPLTQGDQGQLYNPANALADLNPNDIESVEVLKDASSAAIYGSRGSAGVILITTKKGKAGQSTLNYDTYFGYNEPTRKLKVLNAEQYNSTINTLRTNAGLAEAAKYGDIDGDGQPDVIDTDWQDELYRKGLVQNHQLSISGGSQRTSYYASLNYNDFESYIDVNRQRRGSARLNVNSKLSNIITVGINTQFSRTVSYGLGSGTGGALSGVPFGPLTMFPNIPVRDADGEYYLGNGGNTISTNTPNPVAVTHLNKDNRDARRFIGSAFGEIQLYKGLKFKSQINLDYLNAFNDQFWNEKVGDGRGNGVAQTVFSERNNWTWFNTLTYNTKIGADHDISVLAGAEYNRFTSYYAYSFGAGINDPDFKIISADNYASVGADNGIDGLDYGIASYFGGINYSYKEKYLATVNFRTDGHSNFGKEYRWGNFPSASIGWRLSEEAFMAPVQFVKVLKLRTSYGVTGNANNGYYPSLGTFAPSAYADIAALTLENPGNTELKWETHYQFDAGIDAVLFNNTNITIDYYNRRSKDLILRNPVLATLGFPDNVITQNVGTLRSTGIEMGVVTPVLNNKNFNWEVNFNIAWNKTKVLSTNGQGDDIYGGAGLARPGVELGTYYLIRWAGVNPGNGLPTFLDVNGNVVQYDHSIPNIGERWTYVKDGSLAPEITASDRVVHTGKTPYPKFYGGLAQNFRFLNFDASIDVQYAFGFYLFNQTQQTLMSYTDTRNKSVEILDAWTKAGQNTDVPRLYYGDDKWAMTSTRWLEKGDFARIRNVQLGYTFPKTFMNKAKLSRLRLYVQAQNLYTFTGYDGVDPESNSNGNTNVGLGIDYLRPYLPRTYTIGLNVGL
jgi:TonB-linked outer membrane protein, SusC/RagA family